MVLEAPVVATSDGKLEGTQEDGIVVFRGIPYAAPPVGERRWMPPQPVEPWDGTRSAKEFGPVCHQWMDAAHPLTEEFKQNRTLFDSIMIVPGPRSEDCLYLNVWTPALDDAKRPVMFWIHGGGLENGAGSQPNYDGSSLARHKDVVVVTLNMRLGPFGYLRLKDVTQGRIPSTGNEGRMDEIAALAWVRRNIEAFGGNPDNVTIFGQSAGSIEVACLLAARPAKGLFHRAILHSTATHSASDVHRANRMATLFLENAGVSPDQPDSIRALTPEQLVHASAEMLPRMADEDPELGRMHFNPVIDGDFLPQRPYDAIRDGAADDISIMIGTTLDENRIMLGSEPPIALDSASAEAECRNFLGDEAPRVMAEYTRLLERRGVPSTPTDVLSAIQTDRGLRQPAILLSEALHERGNPGFHYVFTYESPVLDGRLRAAHCLELGPLFGTHREPGVREFSGDGPVVEELSKRLQDAWTSFARTGDPSCESAGEWPPYGAARETMMIDTEWSVEKAPYEEERQLWAMFPGDPKLGLF